MSENGPIAEIGYVKDGRIVRRVEIPVGAELTVTPTEADRLEVESPDYTVSVRTDDYGNLVVGLLGNE